MVIDEFYLVNLALSKFLSDFHHNVNTLINIGFICQGRELSLHVQSHLLSFLIDLTANGIDLHILTTDFAGVVVDNVSHQLDGVAIETATK